MDTLIHDKGSADADLVRRLQSASVFATLGGDALDVLAARARIVDVARKTLIAAADQRYGYLGLVLRGSVYVSALLMGSAGSVRPCALFVADAGETFAEFSTLDAEGTVGEIVALTDVEVALFPRESILEAMSHNRAFADAFVRRAIARARDSIKRLSGHLALPMTVRAAQVLLPYAVMEAGLQPADPSLQRITQAQLAAMTGSVKEVLARTVAELEAQGALKRERGHIAYLHAEKLKALATAGMGRI